MEELINQLQSGNYKEAYEGFKKIYEEKGDIIAFYYMSMIDYQFHQIPYDELIKRLNYLMKKGNYLIKEKTIQVYLSILMFELQDLEKAYLISSKEYQKGNHAFLVSFAYAYTSFVVKQDTSDKIIKVLEDALLQDDFDKSFRMSAYEVILKIYLKRQEIDNAKHVLGKLTLLYPQDVRLHVLNLYINIAEDERLVDQDSLDEVLSSPFCLEFINEVSNHFYNEKQFDLCLKYLEMGLGRTNSDLQIKLKMAICLSDLKEFDKAINLIEPCHNDSENALFLLSEIYSFKGDQESLKKALRYCLKSYGEKPTLPKLKVLGDIYNKQYDHENLLKIIDKLKEEYPEDDYYHLLKACYYQDILDFDMCEKEVKKAKKVKNVFLADLAFASFKKPKNAYKYFISYLKKPDYITLIGKYYGEFNIKRGDYQKDLEEVEQGNLDDFDLALLGQIYLNKDKEKAYNYILKGYNRYIDRKDNGVSCVSYYLYCLLNGIGEEKNLEKAYDICKQVLVRESYHVDENLGNMYGELSLLLNKNLEEVYSFLIETRERRYSVSRFYMIIKIGKKLNKNTRVYEKEFKKSFKFANQLEKEYYKDNPESLILNNY